MASISIRKQCVYGTGCKQMAAALCEGCSQSLCTKHFLDHRRSLAEEMNVLINEHDQLQNTVNQQTTSPNSHSLMTQIDQWEKQSIVQIQQKAIVLRQQLLQLTADHLNELSKKLRQLSDKLKEAQEEDSYVETDLQDWKKSLNYLKENLISPSTFSITQHDRNSLVQDITLNMIEKDDLFEQVSDTKVRIGEDGKLASHDASTNCAVEIRGKNEYSTGCHTILLQIEECTGWMFTGINSKSTPLQNQSYNSKSAYGWSSNNYLWKNGNGQSITSAPSFQLKKSDLVSLVLDCDARKVCVINQRTDGKYELDIDIELCPFPWQLHVVLYERNNRVRILPSPYEERTPLFNISVSPPERN